MKSSFFKSLKTIMLGCILCVTFAMIFTSCDNFLKASEIREEIEKVIDYNNAQKVPVLIRAIDGTGSFLVDGEKYFTVNYSVEELQFTVNKGGCIFQGLEAVCKTNPSISRNDCVEITTISSNSVNGVYTYGVKIIKKVDDILIRPKCILRPAVIQYGPLDTEYSSDPIVIHFNTPLEDASVPTENCILDFSNISIKCNNVYIEDCFNNPVLNEDKTILYIYPKSEEFNAFLKSYKDNYISTVEIKVSLDSRTLFTVNSETIQFADNNNLTFTSHYSTDVETVEPIKGEFGIYKNWNSNTKTPSNEFFNDDSYGHFEYDYTSDDNNQHTYYLDEFSNEEFLQNRTKGTIYIYGIYQDTGSGIKNVKVNEQYVPAYYSYLAENDPWNITVNYSKESSGVVYWNTDTNGITTFCIEHKIKHQDCTVQIETTVYDACGNAAGTNYYTLIKINSLNFAWAQLLNVYFNPYKYDADEDDTEYDFDPDTFSAALRNVKLIYTADEDYDDLVFTDDEFAAIYGDREMDPDGIYTTIECRYIDDEGKPQKLTMNKFVYDQDEYPGAKNWNCNIVNVENLDNLTVTIYIEDDLGNSATQDYTFSSTPVIQKVTNNGNAKNIELARRTTVSPSQCILFSKKSNDVNAKWQASYYYNDEVTFEKNYDYYFVAAETYGYLTSDLSPKYTYSSDFSTPNYSIPFAKKYNLKSADEPGKTYVTVEIPKESWDYYENIFLKYKDYYYYYFEKNTQTLTFTINTTNLYKDDDHLDSITLYGENKGICKEGQTRYLFVLDDEINTYDNVPPKQITQVFEHMIDEDITQYKIGIEEKESGLESVTFNNKPWTFQDYSAYYSGEYEWDGGNIIVLNMYDCIDFTTKIPTYNIRIGAKDYADNYKEIIINDRITVVPTPTLSSKSSTTWSFYSSSGSIGVYELQNNKWICRPYTRSTTSMTFSLSNWNLSSKFIRVQSEFSAPKYYYTGLTSNGNFKNTGLYDFILANGSSKKSVVVSSDAPVFVHTLVSSYAYDFCKNWDIDDWEFYKKELGPQQFDFTAKTQQKYDIPVEEINKNECYVVIAHFADGTSVMSDVMVK